jgi:hypothetical protein
MRRSGPNKLCKTFGRYARGNWDPQSMVFRYKPGVFWAFLALTLLVISASPVSALGVPPYPGSAVINSASPAVLEVTILNVASGQPYEVVKDGLTSGAPVYLDRRYTFTTIPADLSNSTYIKTANKDKKTGSGRLPHVLCQPGRDGLRGL